MKIFSIFVDFLPFVLSGSGSFNIYPRSNLCPIFLQWPMRNLFHFSKSNGAHTIFVIESTVIWYIFGLKKKPRMMPRHRSSISRLLIFIFVSLSLSPPFLFSTSQPCFGVRCWSKRSTFLRLYFVCAAAATACGMQVWMRAIRCESAYIVIDQSVRVIVCEK